VVSFLLRGVIGYFFISIEEPNTGYAFGIAILLIVTTNIETIVVRGMFHRAIPGDLRGSMNGVLTSVV